MQNIILFVEPSDDAFCTPAKIGDMITNLFAIDEDAWCEIQRGCCEKGYHRCNGKV